MHIDPRHFWSGAQTVSQPPQLVRIARRVDARVVAAGAPARTTERLAGQLRAHRVDALRARIAGFHARAAVVRVAVGVDLAAVDRSGCCSRRSPRQARADRALARRCTPSSRSRSCRTTLPQPPQLFTSLDRVRRRCRRGQQVRPPTQAPPLPQPPAQRPAVQVWFGPQGPLSQPPQFFTSVLTLTSQPSAATWLQSAKPMAHCSMTQVAAAQPMLAWRARRARTRSCTSRSASRRSRCSRHRGVPGAARVSAAGAAAAHAAAADADVLPEQVSPVEHRLPQWPQFAGSEFVFTSQPSATRWLQSLKPNSQRSIAHAAFIASRRSRSGTGRRRGRSCRSSRGRWLRRRRAGCSRWCCPCTRRSDRRDRRT